MKKMTVWAFAMVTAVGPVLADTSMVGKQLGETQRQALAATNPVAIGGEKFHVLVQDKASKGAGAGAGETLVVNELGVVGRSMHNVLVANVDPETVRALSQAGVLPPTIEASYNSVTRISRLRFNNLADAVQARDLLATRLPQASVTVPVQYNTPHAR